MAFLLSFSARGKPQRLSANNQSGSSVILVRARRVLEIVLEVRLIDPPAQARIRFTTDGTEPSLDHGEDYHGTWTLTQTTILLVTAFLDDEAITRPSTNSSCFSKARFINLPTRMGIRAVHALGRRNLPSTNERNRPTALRKERTRRERPALPGANSGRAAAELEGARIARE